MRISGTVLVFERRGCDRRITLALLMVALLFVSTQAARAQFVASIEDPSFPILDQAVQDQYEEVLELSDGELAVFNAALAAQQAEFGRLQAQRQALRESEMKILDQLFPDGYTGERVGGAKGEELMERRRAISRQQLAIARRIIAFRREARADLRNLLTEEQQGKWDRLMRDARRTRTIIRNHRFIAEPVDLIYVVDERDLRSAVSAEIMEQYAVELDEALVTRNQRIEEALILHSERGQSGYYEFREEHDRLRKLLAQARSTEEQLAISDRFYREWGEQLRQRELEEKRPRMQAHLKVREINLRYLDLIRAQLDDAQDAAFMKAYRGYAYRSYPIFEPYRLDADRYLDAVIADEELVDESTRAEVARIRDEDYIPRRDELNLALADAYERWELRWEDRILKTLDPSYEDQIRRLHERRRALQERVIRDVARLLSDEALEKHEVPETIKDEPRF